jgi:uncharacterized membrane protein
VTLLALLKLVHVLSAIMVVGPNATYVLWLSAAGRDRDRLAFAIRGVREMDRRLAVPAYGLLLLTGLLMVFFGQYDLTQGWLLVAIGLYLVVAIAGMTVMGPAIKRFRSEAERDPTSAAFDAARATSIRYTWGSVIILLVIVTLMVTKPF